MSHQKKLGLVFAAAEAGILFLGLALLVSSHRTIACERAVAAPEPAPVRPTRLTFRREADLQEERALRLVARARDESSRDREAALRLLASERFTEPSAFSIVAVARESLSKPTTPRVEATAPRRTTLAKDRPLPPRPKAPAERKAADEAARIAGAFPRALSTKHYDIFTTASSETLEAAGVSLEVLHEGLTRVFALETEPAGPVAVTIYSSKAEFLEKARPDRTWCAGFYSRSRIVTYEQTTPRDTESLLFHEATHQFEDMALGRERFEAAPRWLIEGLAAYFERSHVRNGELVTDSINDWRLPAVKEMIRAGRVSLRDLLHLSRETWGADHYEPAWSLVYYLVHGTEGGLARFKRYFEGVKAGEDGVKLFEKCFERPLDEIDARWRAWVLGLG